MQVESRSVSFSSVLNVGNPLLWVEASHWACDALNGTAPSANTSNNSPYEV